MELRSEEPAQMSCAALPTLTLIAPDSGFTAGAIYSRLCGILRF
jgi:hypothetical protein